MVGVRLPWTGTLVLSLIIASAPTLLAQNRSTLPNRTGRLPADSLYGGYRIPGTGQDRLFGNGRLSPNGSPADPLVTIDKGRGLAGVDAEWRSYVPAEPVRRDGHTMVLDPVRRRVIVFGGYDIASWRNDVWVLSLDGAGTKRWTRLAILGTPPVGRSTHSAIFDVVGDRMIVYGGQNNGNGLSDLWSLRFSGDTPVWEPLEALSGPGPRWGHSAVYDPHRRRMLVYGGMRGEQALGDLWSLSLDGAPSWTELVRPGGPLPRAYHAALYDVTRDRMVVHGGFTGLVDGSMWGDCWAYSESRALKWQALVAQGPAARDGHLLVHDLAHDRYVLVGGNSGILRFGDAWVFEPGILSWSPIETGPPSPSPRFLFAGVYDPDGDQTVVYGGNEGELRWRSDAWSLRLDPAPLWTRITGETPLPYPTAANPFVTDLVRDRMLSFFNDARRPEILWALRLATMTWDSLATAGTPAVGTSYASVAYDPREDRYLFFGGLEHGKPTNRLWELRMADGTPAWAELSPAGEIPGRRDNAVFVYDPLRHRMLLCGGNVDYAPRYDDLWELSLSPLQWTRLAPAGEIPTARGMCAFVYDPDGDRVIVFGGLAQPMEQPVNEVWELSLGSGPTWSRLTPLGEPPPPTPGSDAVYDSEQRRMLVYGGGYETYLSDVWELSLKQDPEWTRLDMVGKAPGTPVFHGMALDPRRDRFAVWGGFVSGVPTAELSTVSWKRPLRAIRPPVPAPAPAMAARGASSVASTFGVTAPSVSRGAVSIRFSSPGNEEVRLELLDVTGRRLEGRVLSPGRGVHEVTVGGTRPAPGVYFVRARQGANERVVRVAVIE